ncbi:hypothetical protein [Nocardioides conyzicola]|uniref:YfhO family protein n=1 Tax=Nocardioides conyzicola TaxID=1651781 RepID=A0ABP8WXK4_9ACTN
MTTTQNDTGTRERGRWLWPLLVCVVTAAYACLPYVAHPYFFQRGDTAAQFAPTWVHLGDLVRSGQWPPWLDPDAWAGGNYAAEALYGIYNPINILVWLWMSAASDLMLATFVVKLVVLVVLALGAYHLAREYGAARWAAAVVATALPFSGFTLYWDAGSWPSGLMAFAYATWLWWVLRRTLRGATNPFWAFLVGVLTITQGNPYGTLAVVIVGLGLVAEGLLSRNRAGVVRLVLVGLCIAAFLPLVYLPLVETSDLAVRSQGALIENSGKLRPGIGDLLGLSSPTFVPDIKAITGPMRVPATYLFWLVLPLLPWLRYGVLRQRARELSGLGVVTVIYLALSVGPSKLWLFRWPLRLTEYAWLGVAVAFAVLLSQGLQRTHARGRALASAAIVLGAGYLAWAERPAAAHQLAAGVLLVLALVAAVLLWNRWREQATAGLAAICIVGTGLVLGLQVHAFGENASSRYWHLPRDVAAIQERFGDRDGRVMQFADLKPLQEKHPRELQRAWKNYLPGSMYQVADVDAVNAYTGMGMRVFNRHFCMEYDGLTQPCGYPNLWAKSAVAGIPIADLMKVDTVVVQPEMAIGVDIPEGWSIAEQNDAVLVLTRDQPLAWPDSRLSWAADGIDVTSADTEAPLHERVEIADSGDGGQLIFAALGWPGWQAELDGKPVPVTRTKIGMLMVKVPPGASGTLDVTFRPPGLTAGLGAAGIGTLGALVLGVVDWRRRRRPQPDEGAIPHVVGDPPSE